jgi:hypothetical protein
MATMAWTGCTKVMATTRGNDDDVAYGGSQDDRIGGDAGNDLLYGDSGNDAIHGDEGEDVLSGGTGADTLTGGEEHDLLMEDAGDHVAVLSPSLGPTSRGGMGSGNNNCEPRPASSAPLSASVRALEAARDVQTDPKAKQALAAVADLASCGLIETLAKSAKTEAGAIRQALIEGMNGAPKQRLWQPWGHAAAVGPRLRCPCWR